jgi:bifunctional non-homologous end joining protein LigD
MRSTPVRPARPKLGFVEPMKALLVDHLPQGPEWLYEVKFDGCRVLTIKDGKKITLMSRNAKDLTARYSDLVPALQALPARRCILDGEVVAIDSTGRSSFQMLQSYQTPGAPKPPLLYYIFDLLHLNGRALTGLPLVERKALLASVLQQAPDSLRLSASMEAQPARLLQEMKRRGLEGLIAKQRNSSYEAGRRSGAWVKFKWSQEQEFVIGGYTPPKGGRAHFGALLVGYYQKDKLLFASKVGAGFDTKQLTSLHRRFAKYVQPQCPFVNLPERLPSGLSAAEMRICTWLKPQLVCQVRFTEWTRDHHLRHPLFLGLRDDKDAAEVVREKPTRR